MASRSLRLMAEPIRERGPGAAVPDTLTTVYQTVGSAMAHPIRQLVFYNLSDKAVYFSFNGIDNHFVLAVNGAFVLDITANKTFPEGWFVAEGQTIYAKVTGGVNATAGAVYVTALYGQEG